LLEIWIRHFATELNRLLRMHPKHRYVEVDERVGFLRGKLLTERDLAAIGTLTGRYACRYELFTPDHLLNQTLKFCNDLLLGQTSTPLPAPSSKRTSPGLPTSRTVRPKDLARIRLDRLDREYEPLLEMCRLLLEGYAPGLRTGGIEQLAFVFDMNALFEEFVAAFLRRHKDRIELSDGRRFANIEPQRALGKQFGEFNMKVDLILTDTEGQRFLVDTKYKVLDASKQHDGISQSDFYQMYAYGNAGRRRYDRVVLQYPATEPAVDRLFHQAGLALQVRQFALRKICDPNTRRLDIDGAARELGRALTWEDHRLPGAP
jgi:5-methylcytosine-specific restriction enzyme subunit McrC